MANTIPNFKYNYKIVDQIISETVAQNVVNYFNQKEFIACDIDEILDSNSIKFQIGNDKYIELTNESADIVKDTPGLFDKILKTLF